MEFLGTEEIITLIVKVALGFVAAVGAILVWSQTRRASWVVLVLASLFQYLEVLMQLLDRLGLFPMELYQWQGLSLVPLGFAILVPTFYAIGFFLAFRSFRRYEEE
jgi:hypothetical protein